MCGLGLFLFVSLDSCPNCFLSGFSRFLPETLRAVVGDGSIPAGWIYTQPISLIGRHRSAEISSEPPARKPFKNPLLMFVYPEIFVLLIYNGTLYAVMYGVTASLSVIFKKVYPYLNQTEIGLCFIPMGLGMLVGSLLSGRALDSQYRKIRDDVIRQTRADSEKHIDAEAIEKDPSFPIEKARLQILPWVVFVYTTCVVGYGWALQSRVTIAVPLILQFISTYFLRHTTLRLITFHLVGISSVIILNATQTLLVDMMPNQGSSITACVRPPAFLSHLSHGLRSIEISYFLLLEQYRALPLGCWYGVDCEPDPGRTRRRMDICRFWWPLRFGLSLTVRRDPVGTDLATAAGKQG